MIDKFNPLENLEAFVNGNLTESENRVILDYLVSNEDALQEVDRLWAVRQNLADTGQIPELDASQTKHIEALLLKRLHRSELGGKTLWLATAGLLKTVMALLLPILSSTTRSRSK